MIYLDKLKEIRTKKRISRKKLAQDCDISEDLIKLIETIPLDQIEGYDPEIIINVIERIASRLNVDVTDLTSLTDNALKEVEKEQYKLKNSSNIHTPIKVNKNVSASQIVNLYNEVMNKYDFLNINKNNLALKAIQEFEYRVTELQPNKKIQKEDNEISDTIKDIKAHIQNLSNELFQYDGKSEFEKDLESGQIKFLVDKELGFDLNIVNDIRRDARTASTLYKELRLNGFDEDEASHLLYIILTAMNH